MHVVRMVGVCGGDGVCCDCGDTDECSGDGDDSVMGWGCW